MPGRWSHPGPDDRGVGQVGSSISASIPLTEVAKVDGGLHRPESVLTMATGDIFVSDSRGWVTHIHPDGRQQLHAGSSVELDDTVLSSGIASKRGGSFLRAHLGDTQGGVFRLERTGGSHPVLLE